MFEQSIPFTFLGFHLMARFVENLQISYLHAVESQQRSVCFVNSNLSTPHKTLILDLDETLVHSSFYRPQTYDFSVKFCFQCKPFEIFVQKRPGLDFFLQTLFQLFEIYIFTASLEEYSLPVIRALIPNFPISNIRSRKDCKYFNGSFIKDLSIFNRDLSQILIVDNSTTSYCLQPQNGIAATTWTGDALDSELNGRILPILLRCCDVDDVRRTIANA
ncbi:NLI interacting factor-like phosphatase family protein [Histomonas meleagridis]|uniref:NLI interacting factor-like phosphatase family protein n=1 Tax=Histomonas meleagridis TaxID=135588 RepID=UPI00355A3C7B|nr:NLI interacting factor-like phosphatase family protein [Histomonas meleagridis]KAH0799673.1 NLI interacting factor-like phosphatase family protein [Histomonas meleagridis]